MNPERYTGTIQIDGKGSFRYTLVPITDGAGLPANGTITIPGPPKANGQNVFSGMLVKHEMKSGIIAAGKKRAGETWEKHSFRGSDNRWYCTFDEKKVAQLSPAVGTGEPVKLAYEPNAFKSFDIIAVLGS